MAAAITLQTIFIYAGYGEQKNFFFKLSGLTFTLMILIASRFSTNNPNRSQIRELSYYCSKSARVGIMLTATQIRWCARLEKSSTTSRQRWKRQM